MNEKSMPSDVLSIANKHPKIKQYLEQQESEINYLKSRKKYGLVWEEEKTKEDNVKDGRLPVLKEISTKRILSEKGQDNILIEGDNLHALSILNYTHKNKIDVIYIDPPYNTGNATWKYNNKYVGKDDGYRHSKWIDFMNKRLRLAKKLLTSSGKIVVSIDDYEIHTLRLLMDEIFGENNRLSTITVVHNPRGRNDDKHFATMHEYMLIYSLNPLKTNVGYFDLTDSNIKTFNLKDDISKYLLVTYVRGGNNSDRDERPGMFYPIYYDPNTERLDLKPMKNSVKLLPIKNDGTEKVWKWGKATFLERKDTELIVRDIKGSYKIFKKRRLLNVTSKKPRTIWYEPRYDASSHGIKLLLEILGEKNKFPYPKSIWTVYDILSILSKKDSIILDFFAGSGTTGHAVLELNRKDNGKRKFILCTNDEGDICTDVCHPRLQNVINGYKFNGKKKIQLVKFKITRSSLKKNDIGELFEETESNNKNKFDDFEVEVINNEAVLSGIVKTDEKMPGLDGNLKYYKIEQIEKESKSKKTDPPLITDANKRRIINKVTGMLCVKEWCFDLLHENKSLFPKFEIYGNGDGKYMGIIYDSDSTVQFIKKIDSIKKIQKIHTYVFSEILSTILRKNNKVKTESIPVEILEIWNRIFESNICRRVVK